MNVVSQIASAASRQGMLFHSAGICRQNKSYLFPALSGTGKSTISSFADKSGHGVMGDDIALVLERDGQFMLRPIQRQALYKIPHQEPVGDSVTIRACFFIEQGEDITARPIKPMTAFKRSLQENLIFGFRDMNPIEREQVISRLIRFFKNTPTYTLSFKRDNTFWQVIDKLEELGFPEEIISGTNGLRRK